MQARTMHERAKQEYAHGGQKALFMCSLTVGASRAPVSEYVLNALTHLAVCAYPAAHSRQRYCLYMLVGGNLYSRCPQA